MKCRFKQLMLMGLALAFLGCGDTDRGLPLDRSPADDVVSPEQEEEGPEGENEDPQGEVEEPEGENEEPEGENEEPEGEDEEPEEEEPEGEVGLPWEMALFCSGEMEDPLYTGWNLPLHGFGLATDWPIDSPQDMIVVGVGATQLQLEAEDKAATFTWPGPLPFLVPEGSLVQVSRSLFGDMLTGPMGDLAVRRDSGWTDSDLYPLGDLPTLSWETECEVQRNQEICGEVPTPVKFLSLRVGHGSDGILVPSGGTGTIGGWHLTNFLTMDVPYFNVGNCIAESSFRSLIAAFREEN